VTHIFTINLDSRPERWDLFQEGASLWQDAFGGNPERVSAVAGVQLSGYNEKPWFVSRIEESRKKSWGGKAGAILSHRKVIQMAADQGLDNVLIVEDDAFVTEESVRDWKAGLGQLLETLSEDWAMVNLCATKPISPCRVAAEYNGHRLIEASGMSGCVAYFLNGAIFQDLLKKLPEERSVWAWVARHKTIDRWLSRNLIRFGRVYLFAPAIVGHRIGPSDITMTPESEWTHDFDLKDIQLVENRKLFLLLMFLRRIGNACLNHLSRLRLLIKRVRGL